MAQQATEDVYATLILTDNYLPGALVLAQSLRDAGATKKLAVLYTAETVSREVIEELEAVFDYGIPVDRIRNSSPANLYLMNRPDLHSAFTKINLWKLTQFRKIVYLDADVLALRAPDELFDLPHAFSAAPDIGWPDLFNTGVMALTPNMDDYNAMLAMAERGESFDGADQGLFNMYFKDNFHRLSFAYNVTPSAHYQYYPAYKHFQSSINMVHFIGQDKPWFLGRDANKSDSPYSDMLNRWWSVYDKHCQLQQNSGKGPSELLRYFVKGEFQGTGQNGSYTYRAKHPGQPWDAQRQPPPVGARPEAENFPQHHYQMSRDMRHFVPPERYPSPPRNMGYNVPPAEKPKAIFPWESNKPAVSRVFWGDAPPPQTEGSDSPTGSFTTEDTRSDPTTPTATVTAPPTDIWAAFDRSNAWDEDPQIQRYARKLEEKQQLRRLPPHLNKPATVTLVGGESLTRRGLRITDFPSESERPSLPVTPAPTHSQPKSWATGASDDAELPAAKGVPSQAEWDPLAQLEKLAKDQSEVLLRKLGEDEMKNKGGNKQPGTVLSPQPVKGTAAASAMRDIVSRSEESVPQPSYLGPGPTWERGESMATTSSPMPPSEEEKDVLLT